MIGWEITKVNLAAAEKLALVGWEPFAVSNIGNVYLKRPFTIGEALIIEEVTNADDERAEGAVLDTDDAGGGDAPGRANTRRRTVPSV